MGEKRKGKIQVEPARVVDELLWGGRGKKEVKDASWFWPNQPEDFCHHFLKLGTPGFKWRAIKCLVFWVFFFKFVYF